MDRSGASRIDRKWDVSKVLAARETGGLASFKFRVVSYGPNRLQFAELFTLYGVR